MAKVLKNGVKVFILANNWEEFNNTLQRGLEEDSEFMDYDPTWWKGVDMSKANDYPHVQFYDGRASDVAINASGYSVDFL